MYFWFLILLIRTSQGQKQNSGEPSEVDCTWAQGVPDCEEFQDHFDPMPSVIFYKDGPFKKVDFYHSARQGLDCLLYDVLASPKDARDESDPLTIKINVEVLELEELNPQKQELKLQKSLTLEWTDWRLKWPPQCNLTEDWEDYVIDISNTSPLLWQPMFKYAGMKSQIEDNKAIMMQFLYPESGQVSIERLFTEVHVCRAKLRWYPFDSITCAMVHILDETMDKIVLQMNKNNTESEGHQGHIFIAGWTILTQELFLEKTKKFGEKVGHSTLVYKFKFKREISGEVMQTFLPSLMLSIASSSSLYISYDQLPARMGLCATTFLALIALFKGSSDDWPKTAELKAIDVWTILCYAGAFFCLVEYSMVLWFSKQKVNSVEVKL